jgi:Putative Actinobacterial Holin-X, holin superfamily III
VSAVTPDAAGSPAGSGPAAGTEPSIGDLVRDASTQLSTLVRAEIELAKAEIATSAKRAGTGAGFFGAAAAILVFSFVFLFITLAEVLVEIGLARWLAYLIVWVFFLLLAGLCALLGRTFVRRIGKPQRTVETVQATARWARHPTRTAAEQAEADEAEKAQQAGPGGSTI